MITGCSEAAMSLIVSCPTCCRPLIAVPSGWVCEHCNGRIIGSPPQMANESTWDYQRRIKAAVKEVEKRRSDAIRKERSVNWDVVRKSLF